MRDNGDSKIAMRAARQFEHAARDQSKMALARATAQTQADMIANLSRVQQVAENQDSVQQLHRLNQMIAVA